MIAPPLLFSILMTDTPCCLYNHSTNEQNVSSFFSDPLNSYTAIIYFWTPICAVRASAIGSVFVLIENAGSIDMIILHHSGMVFANLKLLLGIIVCPFLYGMSS